MKEIAEYRLQIKYPDGERAPVRLRIGRPKELPTGNWECTAEIEGGAGRIVSSAEPVPLPCMASTSWQALAFALRGLHDLLDAELRRGAVLYAENGKHPIHLDELFPIPRPWQQPPAA